MICVVNQARQVLQRERLACQQTQELAECFAALGEFHLLVEATASFEWFVQAVEKYARRIVLPQPAKLRVIAESTRKSDKLDARVRAQFLAADMIPAAQRPTPRQREHRRPDSIPGLGTTTSEIFLAATADVRRFRSQKKLTAHAGLSPGTRESAGKRKALGITHSGSGLLRWVLTQARWQLVGRDAHWGRIFAALTKRRGKKQALVAVARRRLCLMMLLVLNDRPYRQAA